MSNEVYPRLVEMMPRNRPYPVSRRDGWKIFRGPKLGTIAPDDYLVAQSNKPQTSLHELMDKTFSQSEKKFFVILFGGSECGDVCPNMQSIASALVKRYEGKIDAFAITPYYDSKVYDEIDTVLGDPNLSAEKRYGATGPAIYVIDPEKVIVWKSSGLREDELYLFLNSQLSFV